MKIKIPWANKPQVFNGIFCKDIGFGVHWVRFIFPDKTVQSGMLPVEQMGPFGYGTYWFATPPVYLPPNCTYDAQIYPYDECVGKEFLIYPMFIVIRGR